MSFCASLNRNPDDKPALTLVAANAWSDGHSRHALGIWSYILVTLLGLQMYLGALVVWTMRNSYAVNIRMLTGAFVLATTWMISFVCHRFSFRDDDETPPAGSSVVRFNGQRTKTAELQA